MSSVNIPLEKIRVVTDRENRVALEFYRGTSQSHYLAFTATGPAEFQTSTSSFVRDYTRAANAGKSPLQNIQSFLRAQRAAFLPDAKPANILLELYALALLGCVDALQAKASAAELCAYHNSLAICVGAAAVKKFKSKAEALEKIGALHEFVRTPTPVQQKNKDENTASAARRLSGLSALKESVAANMKAIGSAPASKAGRTQPRAAKAASGAKPAGPLPTTGIGGFCYDLLRKGKSNEQILAAVHKQFPGATTKMASIMWYRNKLRQQGE